MTKKQNKKPDGKKKTDGKKTQKKPDGKARPGALLSPGFEACRSWVLLILFSGLRDVHPSFAMCATHTSRCHPCIPWGDLSDQWERAALRVGEVQALHLHHHLAHHVVAAVSVKGQDHKVQCENLRGKGFRKEANNFVICIAQREIEFVARVALVRSIWYQRPEPTFIHGGTLITHPANFL